MHKTLIRSACAGFAAQLFCAVFLLMPFVAVANERGAPTVDVTKAGNPTPPRTSKDRTGWLQTTDGLTLRLTTDLGSVKIVPLETGSAPQVRYTVHLETDVRA